MHIKHDPQGSPNTLNIISTYPRHVDLPIQSVLLTADQTIPAYIPPLQWDGQLAVRIFRVVERGEQVWSPLLWGGHLWRIKYTPLDPLVSPGFPWLFFPENLQNLYFKLKPSNFISCKYALLNPYVLQKFASWTYPQIQWKIKGEVVFEDPLFFGVICRLLLWCTFFLVSFFLGDLDNKFRSIFILL